MNYQNNELRIGIIVVFFCLLAQTILARTVDKIVAVVNDEVITQSDIDRAVSAVETELRGADAEGKDVQEKLKEVREHIVERMIEEKLIVTEAKKQEFKLDEREIEQKLKAIKGRFINEEEFEETLIQGGLTLKHLRERIRNQELMKKAIDYFIKADIAVNPTEIQAFYLLHQNEFVQPAAVKLKTILFKVKDVSNKEGAMRKAEEVLEKLRQGGQFADLARRYSEASNAADGGDLGFVEQGQSAEDIEKIVFGLGVGEFSGIIETPAGLRIFLAEAKRPSRQLSFTEVQEAVKEKLYREKFTRAFDKWMEKLKKNAAISIREKQEQQDGQE